jgi:hypothetical protein
MTDIEARACTGRYLDGRVNEAPCFIMHDNLDNRTTEALLLEVGEGRGGSEYAGEGRSTTASATGAFYSPAPVGSLGLAVATPSPLRSSTSSSSSSSSQESLSPLYHHQRRHHHTVTLTVGMDEEAWGGGDGESGGNAGEGQWLGGDGEDA